MSRPFSVTVQEAMRDLNGQRRRLEGLATLVLPPESEARVLNAADLVLEAELELGRVFAAHMTFERGALVDDAPTLPLLQAAAEPQRSQVERLGAQHDRGPASTGAESNESKMGGNP